MIVFGQYWCSACGWWGVAQLSRPQWPACPRCGQGACNLYSQGDPYPTNLVTGPDCPSGIQPDERAPDLLAWGVDGYLLYFLADLRDRVTALENKP